MSVSPIKAADLQEEAPIKPWQRLSALMYTSGTPMHDIAAEFNTDVKVISEFLTSAKGVALIKTMLSENQERMINMIEATMVDTLMTVIRIRDKGKTEQSQLAACNQLLDRHLPKLKAADKGAGKNQDANQFINAQAEIARLRGELGGKLV